MRGVPARTDGCYLPGTVKQRNWGSNFETSSYSSGHNLRYEYSPPWYPTLGGLLAHANSQLNERISADGSHHRIFPKYECRTIPLHCMTSELEPGLTYRTNQICADNALAQYISEYFVQLVLYSRTLVFSLCWHGKKR